MRMSYSAATCMLTYFCCLSDIFIVVKEFWVLFIVVTIVIIAGHFCHFQHGPWRVMERKREIMNLEVKTGM